LVLARPRLPPESQPWLRFLGIRAALPALPRVFDLIHPSGPREPARARSRYLVALRYRVEDRS